MKKSVIDMGSNSVRLMLAACDGGRITASEKHLEMTRLAQGVDASGRLQEPPMALTIEVIRRYRAMAAEAGAEPPVAYATSAVRDAANGEEFARRVFRETGVPVRIVPGELEAELGFLGVAATLPDPEEPVLVVDIGGGSTECIVGSGAGIRFAQSRNVGAVRMTGRHLTRDPMDPGEWAVLKQDIADGLAEVCEALKAQRFSRIYGIGGTLTTAAAMVLGLTVYDPAAVQHYPVTREALGALLEQVCALPLARRRLLPGLQPKRADVIPAGFQIMASLMDCLGADRFHASDADNLEGVLFKYHMDGGC